MDHKNDIGYRNYEFHKFEKTGNNKYDYEKNGILTKTLPKILFKGNSILVTFLQFIDMRIIMLFKYIDKLKYYKHYTRTY